MQGENMFGRINRDALKFYSGGPFVGFYNSTLAPDAVGPSTPPLALDLTLRRSTLMPNLVRHEAVDESEPLPLGIRSNRKTKESRSFSEEKG
jgi:hypothetical protein